MKTESVLAEKNRRFTEAVTLLGEHFEDYAIVVRVGDGKTFRKASDGNWASGAMDTWVKTMDALSIRDEIRHWDARGE